MWGEGKVRVGSRINLQTLKKKRIHVDRYKKMFKKYIEGVTKGSV